MLTTIAKLRKPFVFLTVVFCAVELGWGRWNAALGLDPGVVPPALRAAAAGAVAAGAALRCWSAGLIVKREVLAMSGPYRHLRHPLYAGSILMAAGFALYLGNALVAATVAFYAGVFYTLAMIDEERKMLVRFGEDYRRYLAVTHRLWPSWRLAPTDTDRWDARRFLANRGYMAPIYGALGLAAIELLRRFPLVE